jgi:hypothetical protein
VDTKPFYLSKVFWFNLASGLWFLIGPKVGIPTLGADTFAEFVLVANIILRAITKGAISLT